MVGYMELAEFGTGSSPSSIFASRLISICFGIGAALTLDEFALWLNLSADAYWTRQGRESIDAVILFGALLAVGSWGAPIWTRRTHHPRPELQAPPQPGAPCPWCWDMGARPENPAIPAAATCDLCPEPCAL